MTKMTSCLIGCAISVLALIIGSPATNAQGVLEGQSHQVGQAMQRQLNANGNNTAQPDPSDARRIYFNYTQGGQHYMLQVLVSSWSNSPGNLSSQPYHPGPDFKPYISFQQISGLFSPKIPRKYIKPDKLERAWANRNWDAVLPWKISYDGVTADAIRSLDIALCPADVEPTRDVCLFNTTESISYHIYRDDNTLVKSLTNDHRNASLSSAYEISLRALGGELSGMTDEAVAATKQRGRDAQAAAEQAARKEITEKRNQALATLKQLRPHAQLFCSSGPSNSLPQGKPLNAIPYICSDLGDTAFELSELLQYGLKVTSENRTPANPGRNDGQFAVSLILEKK